MIAPCESAQLAEDLIATTAERQEIPRGVEAHASPGFSVVPRARSARLL